MKNKPIVSITSFEAQISLIDAMMNWIRDQLIQVKQPDTELRKIEIAVEEALVNIISYAYKKPGGNIEIEFYYLPKDQFSFIIKDKGIPFNPIREESEIEKNLPLEEREEGGLGIPMIHKLVDSVHYERIENINVLTLSKKII